MVYSAVHSVRSGEANNLQQTKTSSNMSAKLIRESAAIMHWSNQHKMIYEPQLYMLYIGLFLLFPGTRHTQPEW